MPFRIRHCERVNDGMVRVNGRPWTKARLRGKVKRCQVCDKSLEPKTHAYRPVVEGEGVVRRMRVCCPCIETAIGLSVGRRNYPYE